LQRFAFVWFTVWISVWIAVCLFPVEHLPSDAQASDNLLAAFCAVVTFLILEFFQAASHNAGLPVMLLLVTSRGMCVCAVVAVTLLAYTCM
jgi:hypothetical protein